MAVDIDEVLQAIGEVGPYQRRIYFLLCLPILFVGAANFAYVFIAASPLYRCEILGCDEVRSPTYDEPFLNFTIPWDNNTKQYDSCHHYQRSPQSEVTDCTDNDFTKDIVQCEGGVVFDNSVYESTIVTEFNLTCRENWEASADQATYFGGILVGALVFGIASDMFGRRKIILLGIVLMATSGTITALVPNLTSFHIARFINAMSSSGVFQTAFILGLEFVGPGKRVMFGVIGEYFFALGEILLGLLAWAIRSWRMVQLVISAPVCCFIFYYWVVPESVRWLQAKGRHTQVVASLENIAKVNKRTIPLNLLRHQPLEEENQDESDDLDVLISRQHKVTMFDIIKSPIMLFRTFFMILIWISTTLTYYGLGYEAGDLGAGNPSNKPFINFILCALVELPGYTLAWLGMDFLGRKWSLMGSLFVSGTACMSIGYLKDSLPILLIFLLGKCSITCAFAIIYVFTAEMFPTNVRNTIVGVCSMFARIGGMIAPFSLYLKIYYVQLPILLFGFVTLASSLMSLIMPETLNTKLPETVSEAVRLGKRAETLRIESHSHSEHQEENERLLADSSDNEQSPRT